jgi:hypothetical protein
MMKGYANVVPLAYVILMSLVSFDMSTCTLAAMDEINNLIYPSFIPTSEIFLSLNLLCMR